MRPANPDAAASPQPRAMTAEGAGGTAPGAVNVVTIHPRRQDTRDRAQSWLRNAMIALAVLAAAAAAVSWDAQYVLVRAVKHNTPIAALEAGIPEMGALIFAALGIAVALHGKHAIRALVLNIACVGTSLAMNALASARGWQDLGMRCTTRSPATTSY